MRIITNFERFPVEWRAPGGETGSSLLISRHEEFAARTGEADLALVNGDVPLVYRLCLDFLKSPGSRKPIVAADLVLRRPETLQARFATYGKKLLLRRVDHFINYFRKSAPYSRYYGITPERSTFVNFKPSLRHRSNPEFESAGGYILCFGRSRRDYDTFFRAAELTKLPCAIPAPNFAELKKHGSRFTYPPEAIPPNVTLLPDDGTEMSMIRAIEGARAVALPIVKESLLAGVSVYLNAMYLGRCVIITEGPGASDALSDEALFVPPEDARALAQSMRTAWENDALRIETARKGYEHAASLGGEPELYQRVLGATMDWLRTSRSR